MLLSKTFLSLILIALSVVDANPLVHRDSSKASLRFATRFNLDTRTTGRSSIPEIDRARARSMKRTSHPSKRSILPQSVNITNHFVSYVAQVGIGKPQHNYTLMIDTGSSNTFVGVNKSNPYVPTNTSINTRNRFNVTYGTGDVNGTEWLDTVTLGPGLVIQNQSIAALSYSAGAFNNVDGILGVGPVNLTSKTVNNTYRVPTVMDNLYTQGTISQEALGVFFMPSNETNTGGELTFGGYDPTAITGLTPNYVPLTTTYPASLYWGVNLTVSYGDQTILSNTAGIVDTGTTQLTLATDAFKKYQSLTGAVVDKTTGLLSISNTQYNNLQALSFNIGGTSYDLTPNAQIWPRSLNTAIGGNKNVIYLIVNDIGTPSGSGLDFTLGFVFLQRFYTVYDTTNRRIGFAATIYSNSNSN